jgi:sulfatase modifying factor 1
MNQEGNAMAPATTINPRDGAEMITIPPGEFLMGTSDAEVEALLRQYPDDPDEKREMFVKEQPQRRIYLDGYSIYKTPVTVAQYRTFCWESGRPMPPWPEWGWQDDHPMVNVTWPEAVAYCEWAGVRLPTEAEWEKAARGTDGRRYPWGDEWDSARCHCSKVERHDAGSTARVGRYPQGASPYGVLDMAGNACDWCADWYDETYYQNAPDRNPTGPPSGEKRVLRGGAWLFHHPLAFRCTLREAFAPLKRLHWGDGSFRPVSGP